MVESAQTVFDHINSLDSFTANENSWFHVYPDENHSPENWMKRLWSDLKMLSADRQEPRNAARANDFEEEDNNGACGLPLAITVQLLALAVHWL